MNLISRVFILSVCVFTVCALPNLGNLHELHDKLIYTFAANSTGNSTTGNNTQNNCSLPGNNTGSGNSTGNGNCTIEVPGNNTQNNCTLPGNSTGNGNCTIEVPGNNTQNNCTLPGNSTGNGNCTIVVPGNNNTSNGTQNNCIEVYKIELDIINAETVIKSEACYVSARLSLAAMDESIIKTKESVNRQSIELQSRLASCAARWPSEAIFDCYTATFDQNLGNLNNITVQSEVASAALSGYEYEVEITAQACVGKVLIESKTNSTLAANEMQGCMKSQNNSSNITPYEAMPVPMLVLLP